jgi:hypothetical protein
MDGMSFPRLTLLALPLALCAPLLAGGCGAPVAVTGASYGADGVSAVATSKTTTDHFLSMVSKKDCAMWRVFRNQGVCREREGDPNPYKVNYDEPFRQVSEGGVEYASAPHSSADAPPASWDSAAYKPGPQSPSLETAAAPATQAQATVVQHEAPVTLAPPPAAAPAPPKAKAAHSASAKAKKKKPVKKPAPDQVASSR